MKKFLFSILLVLTIALGIVATPFAGIRVANAQQQNEASIAGAIKPGIQKYLNEFVEAEEETKTRAYRLAGSEGERLASQYISQTLKNLGLVSRDYADGLQKFDVFSSYENKKVSSQNVLYTLKGAESNSKKVIITTNYDNYYDGYFNNSGKAEYKTFKAEDDYSEGVNYSAAGVATLLALAEYLPSETLPFDVEFVFLGASSLDNAGAKHYSQTLPVAARNNTLLILDISDIALGKEVYYYTGEFATSASKAYAKNNMLSGLKKFSNGFAGIAEMDATDLGYTSAGYSGATSVFLGQKINVLHLFSGDYTNGLFAGKREYADKPIITGTNKDNLEYIKQNHGTDYLDNPSKAAVAVCELLANEQFIQVHSGAVSDGAYNFYANKTMHKLIFGLVFVALIAVSFVVYNVLYKQSYAYAFNNKLKGVMLTLDEGKDKPEDNLPTASSSVQSGKSEKPNVPDDKPEATQDKQKDEE